MGGSRNKVLLTVQQISFAKLLAANDKKTRDKGLKKLRNYFSARSEGLQIFAEDDFKRIWKGLYYCMWMSDKPLVQEELAENISALVHCLKQADPAILFMQAFFSTMGIEWFGIDQHRLDKFLMLVRRFLRQTLVYCQRRDWDGDLVDKMTKMFSSTVFSVSTAGRPSQLGLTLHFTDIFLEELAKVSKGKLPEDTLLKFLQPFLKHLSEQDEPRSRSHVTKHIFHHLMKQSDTGIEYEERFTAWKEAGFPGESCEDMQKIKLDDVSDDAEEIFSGEEYDTDIKDPRAGKVDVVLPQLSFNAEKISALILNYAKQASVLKGRKVLYQLAEEFSEMAKGNYPLALKLKVPEGILGKKKKSRKKRKELWGAAERLVSFEKSLNDDDADESEGKKRKFIEGESESDEEFIPSKFKKLEVQLKRVDSSNENIKGKVKKQKIKKVSKVLRKAEDGAHNTSNDIVLNGDGVNNRLGERKVHKKKLKLNSSEQMKTLLKRKASSGVKTKIPHKLKKTVTPLKKLQVKLNRWEVTDICNKVNQDSPALVQNSSLVTPESRIQLPEMEELPSIKTPNKRNQDEMESSPTKSNVISPKQRRSPRTPGRKSLLNGTFGSAKKVNIALQMNKEQKMSDYVKAVMMSPSIPFDAAKKPVQGVLKPSPMSSPINPFYRRSGRKLNHMNF